jgi:hypothetical protein
MTCNFTWILMTDVQTYEKKNILPIELPSMVEAEKVSDHPRKMSLLDPWSDRYTVHHSVDMWINMEHWLNGTDRKNWKSSEKLPSQCHFVDCPGSEEKLLRWEASDINVITVAHNSYVMLRSCHENSFQLNSIMPVTSTNLICTRLRYKKIDNSYCERVEKFRYLEKS